MSGSLCFWNLCVRKFCSYYNDRIVVVYGGMNYENMDNDNV